MSLLSLAFVPLIWLVKSAHRLKYMVEFSVNRQLVGPKQLFGANETKFIFISVIIVYRFLC